MVTRGQGSDPSGISNKATISSARTIILLSPFTLSALYGSRPESRKLTFVCWSEVL